MTGTDLLYVRAEGTGWGPVDELAALAARLLDAELRTVQDRGDVSLPRKLAAALPRRRGGSRHLLLLVAAPGHLAHLVRARHWVPGYASVNAWVIDSFWTDRMPRAARHRGHLDHVFVTDGDLVPLWEELTGAAVHHAPWGTDTLLAPPAGGERPVDLLRVGRQPPAWDDDEAVRLAALRHGLVAEGRPPMSADPHRNQASVRAALGRSRTALAFSNLVSPAPYTHPTRDYVTGRWTDALAAGCTVAGVAPAAAPALLGPGATLEIDPHDLDRGLARIAEHLETWTPAVAAAHRERARRELDWRHRLARIVEITDITPSPDLAREIAQLGAPGVDR